MRVKRSTKYRSKRRGFRGPLSRGQVKAVARVATKVVNRKIETKLAQFNNSSYDGAAIGQAGTFWNLISTLNSGIGLPQGTAENQRIGDKIQCRGMSLRLVVTNNDTFVVKSGISDSLAYRIVIFATKDTAPTKSTLFRNNSTPTLMSTDTDQNKILYDRVHMLRITAAVSTVSGTFSQKFVRIWIPGAKIGYKGQLHFQDNSNTVLKGYNYHLAVFATYPGDPGTPIGDVIWNGVFYYKDA